MRTRWTFETPLRPSQGHGGGAGVAVVATVRLKANAVPTAKPYERLTVEVHLRAVFTQQAGCFWTHASV
jgi:hypothetical protein